MDYLEKEYQENPLIDFDRRAFNNEGSSFEGYLSNIENKEKKESLQEHLLKQKGFLAQKVPENMMEFFIYSLDRNGYLREESIDEVTNIFAEYTKEQIKEFITYMQQMEPTGVFARNLQECMQEVLRDLKQTARTREQSVQTAKLLYSLADSALRLNVENTLSELTQEQSESEYIVSEPEQCMEFG